MHRAALFTEDNTLLLQILSLHFGVKWLLFELGLHFLFAIVHCFLAPVVRQVNLHPLDLDLLLYILFLLVPTLQEDVHGLVQSLADLGQFIRRNLLIQLSTSSLLLPLSSSLCFQLASLRLLFFRLFFTEIDLSLRDSFLNTVSACSAIGEG